MVKNFVDELADILDWNANPGLSREQEEQAHACLVTFCRGLVCGLRFGQPVPSNTPISVYEEQFNMYKAAEPKRRLDEARCGEDRRRKCENAQIRPVDTNRLRTADEKVQEAIDNLHDAGRL